MKKILTLPTALLFSLFPVSHIFAQEGIKNPAIPMAIGGKPAEASAGITFTKYFIMLWNGIIIIGTISMLFHLVNGAMEWIVAGGESEKVKHARMKMTESVVGLIILLGTFAMATFIGQVFGFNVLKFSIPTPDSTTSAPT